MVVCESDLRRMKKFLPLFVVAVLLGGCANRPDVTSYTHPLSGRRTDIMSNNLLDIPYSDRELIWLNAYRDFSDLSQYKYYLEIVYGAKQEVGYLEIGPGRTLTIIADDDELKFASLGSLKKWEDKGAIFESARYDASSYDISKIANAKKVVVKVTGKNGLVVRQFGPDNFAKFREFSGMGH
jgi:hypothetical protein